MRFDMDQYINLRREALPRRLDADQDKGPEEIDFGGRP